MPTPQWGLKNDHEPGGPLSEAWVDAVANDLELARWGWLSQAVADGADTNIAATDTAPVIRLTGALTAARNLIVRTAAGARYWILNSTTGGFAVTVKTLAGTGIAVQPGTVAFLFCDGTNILRARGPHETTALIEDLAAGADFTARAEFAAPATGCVLTKIGMVSKAAPAGVNDANTVVVAVADAAANAIVTKTYNTANQPPAAAAYGDLGTLHATNRILTANEVVTVAVTQGATADLGAFFLVFEWEPTAA